MLLTPTTAPIVHLEQLPETASAVLVKAGDTAISVQTWASGPAMDCDEDASENPEDWVEGHCHDCRFYCEDMEHDADGEEINGLQLTGTYYTYSPCPCYTDGVGYVSFPCEEGYDGPEDSDITELSTDYMSYVIHLHNVDYHVNADSLAYQQRVDNDGSTVVSTPQYPAVNCFSDDKICWGDNDEGFDLANIHTIFTDSVANQDLTSFEDHKDNHWYLSRKDPTTPVENAVPLSAADEPKAVVIASSTSDASAFILMAAAGCKVSRYVASVPVYYYPQVELQPGVVCNVWATNELSTGTRLLFRYYINDKPGLNCEFLGQVPSTFNLSQCKLPQQQSSEQAEPVNT